MPKDLIQLQSELQNMTDQDLVAVMQGSPDVPQYLVLTEMQRRGDQREAYQRDKASRQVERTSVADRYVMDSLQGINRQQGVAGLSGKSTVGMGLGPTGGALTGARGYKNGGQVKRKFAAGGAVGAPLSDEDLARLKGLARERAASYKSPTAAQIASTASMPDHSSAYVPSSPFGRMMDRVGEKWSEGSARVDRLNALRERTAPYKSRRSIWGAFSTEDYEGQRAAETKMANFYDDFEREIVADPNMFQAAIEDPDAFYKQYGQNMQAYADKVRNVPLPKDKPERPSRVASAATAGSTPGRGGGATTAVVPASVGVGLGAPGGDVIDIGNGGVSATDGGLGIGADIPDRPAQQRLDKAADMAQASYVGGLMDDVQKLRSQVEGLEGSRSQYNPEDAVTMALLSAGGSMLGGQSPFAGVNIGAGIQQGLETYMGYRGQMTEEDLARRKLAATMQGGVVSAGLGLEQEARLAEYNQGQLDYQNRMITEGRKGTKTPLIQLAEESARIHGRARPNNEDYAWARMQYTAGQQINAGARIRTAEMGLIPDYAEFGMYSDMMGVPNPVYYNPLMGGTPAAPGRAGSAAGAPRVIKMDE